MTEILDKILMDINPEIVENRKINLIEEGVITSLDLISIVSEIEEELKVEIDFEDIVTDNFTSYDAIKKLFLKYLST
jgi:D-alanine--poly(phosphoribitol) ligase subunit 2